MLKNWFELDEVSGNVYVRTPIDREIAEYVDIVVYVEDLNAHESFRPQIASCKFKCLP
jgi:hypothetical protein